MSIHMIVGSLTLLAFVVNTVMYGMSMNRTTAMPYHRLISIGAATLLLLQWALGFMLLGEGEEISIWHIVLALATILPVGMEHMMTAQETDSKRRATIGMIASAVTTILVLVAYAIGEMGA